MYSARRIDLLFNKGLKSKYARKLQLSLTEHCFCCAVKLFTIFLLFLLPMTSHGSKTFLYILIFLPFSPTVLCNFFWYQHVLSRWSISKKCDCMSAKHAGVGIPTWLLSTKKTKKKLVVKLAAYIIVARLLNILIPLTFPYILMYKH